MKQLSKLFLVLSVATAFVSCKSLEINPPVESYVPSVINPVRSDFPLRVSIDVKKLESTINQKMSGLLFQGDKINNQDLSVQVWKAQPFQFTVKNNVIEYKVPLKISSKFKWAVQKFGLTVGDTYQADGTIVLNYRTTVSIDQNWKLVTQTSSNGYQWLSAPTLNVAGVQLPVTPIANYALNQGNAMISQQIDQVLTQMVDLRKYANMAWTVIQKPMLMDPATQLWIKVTPQSLTLSPLQTIGNNLNMTISLGGLVESVMGSQPAKTKNVALPALGLTQTNPSDFSLNLAADVTMDQINKMAAQQLINQTFKDGNKSVTIKDMKLYGSNGKLICMLDMIGSLKGKVYFTGNLAYNPQTSSVEVQNPEFDVKTQNALVKSAGWLLHGLILEKIKPYLNYSVADQLKDIKVKSNAMLKDYTVMDGVKLSGNINNVKVNDLQLIPGALRIVAQASGNVQLKVADLKF